MKGNNEMKTAVKYLTHQNFQSIKKSSYQNIEHFLGKALENINK
jgi:hypothetical protein